MISKRSKTGESKHKKIGKQGIFLDTVRLKPLVPHGLRAPSEIDLPLSAHRGQGKPCQEE